MVQLGGMIEGQEGGEGWMRSLRGVGGVGSEGSKGRGREDIPDYATLYRMAQAEVARGGGKAEEETKEGEGGDTSPGRPSPLRARAPPPARFAEWRLRWWEARYRSVECSHAELQRHAERINGTHARGWRRVEEGGLGLGVRQGGEVWWMGSPMGPGMWVAGMVGSDGVWRLEGEMEREEGQGAMVRWTERLEMRVVEGGWDRGEEEEGEEEWGEAGEEWVRWEGERELVRVRRRYAGWNEDDVEVVMRWQWDVRWEMRSEVTPPHSPS